MSNRTSSDALTLPDGCACIVRACSGLTYRVIDCYLDGVHNGETWYAGTAQSPSQGPRHFEFTADAVVEIEDPAIRETSARR